MLLGSDRQWATALPCVTSQKESPEKKKARLQMEALASKEAEQSRAELARVKCVQAAKQLGVARRKRRCGKLSHTAVAGASACAEHPTVPLLTQHPTLCPQAP